MTRTLLLPVLRFGGEDEADEGLGLFVATERMENGLVAEEDREVVSAAVRHEWIDRSLQPVEYLMRSLLIR